MYKAYLKRRLQSSILAAAALFLLPCTHLSAALITDPIGDFLPSFTGPKNPDLDVTSAQVFFNGSTFSFNATLDGLIGTTPGALYVWGINRGAGTVGFPTIAPGVTFDSVFIITNTGTGTIRDLITGTATTITNVAISGSSISATVPLSLLPSEGFSAANYLVNLWPRSGAGGIEVISDFAPNNSDAAVTVVASAPEPGSVSFVSGALLVGVSLIRRRRNCVR